ncbi:hypothetical protein [Enterovibrio coralii]|uniref:Uncharacterized protein n=1 Tax=Enterovibrio coralii TaxID=294935 RepID=A0A135I664_9GAMM|nr:hypothetical protein [Enterovibrio coralii]KXF80932.1 hypothetical protein ATN88_17880 [Enterovibrio coralii]
MRVVSTLVTTLFLASLSSLSLADEQEVKTAEMVEKERVQELDTLGDDAAKDAEEVIKKGEAEMKEMEEKTKTDT